MYDCTIEYPYHTELQKLLAEVLSIDFPEESYEKISGAVSTTLDGYKDTQKLECL